MSAQSVKRTPNAVGMIEAGALSTPAGALRPVSSFGPAEVGVLVASTIVSSIVFPIFLLVSLMRPRLRRCLRERLGGGAWNEVQVSAEEKLWFHTASFGEVVGVSTLMTRCREHFSKLPQLCTTTSDTGRAEALRRKTAQHVAILPYDHPFFVTVALRRANARLLILAETELWPVLILLTRARGVPLVLVNGRISDRSFPRYRMWRIAVRPLLRSFALILVQSETDRERFIALGASQESVRVAGSTKYSEDSAIEVADVPKETLALRLRVNASAPCFVAGSVRPGEDEMVIRAFTELRMEFPALQMILAPRHPERFEAVADFLRTNGVLFHRRSQPTDEPQSVLLLDTLGELRDAYRLASVAFVGGTLVPIGGHNPLEPARFGTPVLLGPHYENARDAVEQLLTDNGALVVRDSRELADRLKVLIGDERLRAEMGNQAKQTWIRNAMAVDQMVPILEELLTPAPSPRG